MRVRVIPQNSVGVWIEFNDYLATATCFFGANFVAPVRMFFFELCPASGRLAQADIKLLLGPERSTVLNHGPVLNRGSDELD
jgi:hypothetical protein